MAGYLVGAAHVSAAARFLHQEAMPLGSRYQGGAHATVEDHDVVVGQGHAVARASRTGKPPASVLAALMMWAAGAPVKLSLCCRPAPAAQLRHCRTRGCPGKAAFSLAASAPGPCRPHMTSAAPRDRGLNLSLPANRR